MPKVGIIMGSDSDLPVMKKATTILDDLGIDYEVTISSAHRTPKKTEKWAKEAEERGVEVIIAGAGASAALPGVVAAFTDLPVIGVPLKAWAFDGLDALMSIAQMPPGVPVATMAVDGSKNAALFAARILARSSDEIRKALQQYMDEQAEAVEEKDKKLNDNGIGEFA